MHVLQSVYGKLPQRSFKIGVAIPVHVDDKQFLDLCLDSILKLNPQPYVTTINLNWNSCLEVALTKLFDRLFNLEHCSVVLKVDVDFWLFPQILKYVKNDSVVSFTPLTRSVRVLPLTLIRLFYHGWSGLYSIPIEEWCKHKGLMDSALKQAVGKNYEVVKRFLYYPTRGYTNEHLQKLLGEKSTLRKLIWRFTRMGIG